MKIEGITKEQIGSGTALAAASLVVEAAQTKTVGSEMFVQRSKRRVDDVIRLKSNLHEYKRHMFAGDHPFRSKKDIEVHPLGVDF